MKYYQNKFFLFALHEILFFAFLSNDIFAQNSNFVSAEIREVIILADSAYRSILPDYRVENNGLVLIRQIKSSKDSINYHVYFVFDDYSNMLNFLGVNKYWLIEEPPIDRMVLVEGINESAINIDMKLKPFVTSINNGMPASYEPEYVLITSNSRILKCLGWRN